MHLLLFVGFNKRGKTTEPLQIYLPKGFNVVGTVCTSGKVRQVELNLIPAFI